MTKWTPLLTAFALLLAGSAHAAANWQSVSFRAVPGNVPALVAATEKFMASDAGKAMPGTLSLMASVIDGGDPATHSFITSMESMAAREKWTASLQGNTDWATFRDSIWKLTDLGATSRMIFRKHWGEAGDTDVVWEIFALRVDDPAGYLAALDALMASETGKGFPGSLHLSSIAAAGLSSVSHLVSVGYASEAEAEAWNETMEASADWAAFIKAISPISNVEGTFVLRTLQTWGTPMTMP